MAIQLCPICGERSTLRPGPGRLGRGTRHLDCVHEHAMTAPFDEWIAAYSRQVQAEVEAWLHPSDDVVDHDHAWELVEVHDVFVHLECGRCAALALDERA